VTSGDNILMISW